MNLTLRHTLQVVLPRPSRKLAGAEMKKQLIVEVRSGQVRSLLTRSARSRLREEETQSGEVLSGGLG